MVTANNALANGYNWPHNVFPVTNPAMRKHVATADPLLLVTNILLQVGIPVHMKGYVYLREAILMKSSDPQAEMPVTKILYPDIAKKFRTSAARVERAIRHAIGTAWHRTASSCRDENLLYPFSPEMRPTNSRFIAIMADRVAMLCKNCR